MVHTSDNIRLQRKTTLGIQIIEEGSNSLKK